MQANRREIKGNDRKWNEMKGNEKEMKRNEGKWKENERNMNRNWKKRTENRKLLR